MAPPSGNMIETPAQNEFQHGSFPVGFEQISALRILFSGSYNKRVKEGKRGGWEECYLLYETYTADCQSF